ncbi:hypothetical protein GCM10010252_38150 [Streptomyces aureoverticillatus]|nr:hypothetical protein GCM10010252_38150 [Streptomyces aureoverticillatus]
MARVVSPTAAAISPIRMPPVETLTLRQGQAAAVRWALTAANEFVRRLAVRWALGADGGEQCVRRPVVRWAPTAANEFVRRLAVRWALTGANEFVWRPVVRWALTGVNSLSGVLWCAGRRRLRTSPSGV